MNRLLKAWTVVAALVAATVSVLVTVDVMDDRKMKVSITERVPLYADWDDGPRQSAIGEIGPSTPKVLRVRYGKDCQAIRVRTDAGETGWVFGGGSVRLGR